MRYSKCKEVLNSDPPSKDRSHILMKRYNKDNRKQRQTRLNNEINNYSKEGFYIVQNSLIEGEIIDENNEDFAKVATLSVSEQVMGTPVKQPLMSSQEIKPIEKKEKSNAYKQLLTKKMTLFNPGRNVNSGLFLSEKEENDNIKKVINKEVSSFEDEDNKLEDDTNNNKFIMLGKNTQNNSCLNADNDSKPGKPKNNSNSLNNNDKNSKDYNNPNENTEHNESCGTEGRKNTDNQLLLIENKPSNSNKSSAKSTPKASPRDTDINNVKDTKDMNENSKHNTNKNEEYDDINKSLLNKSNMTENSSYRNSGKIDVQNILIDNLRNGEHVFYCLNMLTFINENMINLLLSEY